MRSTTYGLKELNPKEVTIPPWLRKRGTQDKDKRHQWHSKSRVFLETDRRHYREALRLAGQETIAVACYNQESRSRPNRRSKVEKAFQSSLEFGLVARWNTLHRGSPKNAVRLTFPKGALLKDPKKLINTRLDSKMIPAIDFHENDALDETALKALILEAAELNTSKVRG